MKFYKYLIEKWQYARDQDYIVKGNIVIIFDEEDDYKRRGMTHGLKSHAIKHGMEFNLSHYNNLLDRMGNYIEKTNYRLLNRKGDIIKGVQISRNMLINTLDRINDKIVKGRLLTDEEQWIYKNIIDPIKEKYYDVYKSIEKSSIDITELSKEEIEKILDKNLKINTTDGRIVYFNFKTLHFGIKESNGKQSTLYILKNENKLVEKLKQFDYKTDVLIKTIGE